MNIVTFENVIKNIDEYVGDIFNHGFQELANEQYAFVNIQPRDNNDEFAKYCCNLFRGHRVAFNFVINSPLNETASKFVHDKKMMGDVTCVLYLNALEWDDDFYVVNKGVAFNSSEEGFKKFVENKTDKLIQVVFLKCKQ